MSRLIKKKKEERFRMEMNSVATWLHLNCSPESRALNPDFGAYPLEDYHRYNSLPNVFKLNLLYSVNDVFSKFVNFSWKLFLFTCEECD